MTLVRFLESIKDEATMASFCRQLDHNSLRSLLELIEHCESEQKNKWIRACNQLN